MKKSIRILGIRGLPAAHGGFETFAEKLALHLVDRGWRVQVYCQEDGKGKIWEDTWRGIHRIHVPVRLNGPMGTILFDLRSILHACRSRVLCLTLGYNTAIFCLLLRALRIPNVINMDGIEWARAKWGRMAKLWFWLNDWAGCWIGDHLIADHPAIKKHLSTRVASGKVSTIAYGGDEILDAPTWPLSEWGLTSGQYVTLIARAEPENSILEVVQTYSCRKRPYKLVVLGAYDKKHAYQRQVLSAAGDDVIFTGPVYEKEIVSSLRFHSLAYIHGHQVGGTNPSLVEALGAGNPIIAHDNPFNRWVAGTDAVFFSDSRTLGHAFDRLEDNDAVTSMSRASRDRHKLEFTWQQILNQYEALLDRYQDDVAELVGQ